MKREYYKWFCGGLGRDMELLVFGHAGARVLVFPTRSGRFFDYENMGMVDALGHHIRMGWLQLYCVDSIDHETFYCDWCEPRGRIVRHMEYEKYVLNEVLPLSRSLNDNPFAISHGCSLGAYHAVNIALRHPEIFNRVVALSGRYDLTQSPPGYRNLFDGYYDSDIYFHMPNHYMPNMNDHDALERIRRLDIKIVVGEADPFYPDNQFLSDTLWNKGIWHLFKVWSGKAHSYRRWREMVCWFV
ncbi:MAG: esterase [Alphaproteobacteria bacterium]|jgi:esterase/lipase superfamily enzyme|nr:esterase [Alphaproteobacteria bacterium]